MASQILIRFAGTIALLSLAAGPALGQVTLGWGQHPPYGSGYVGNVPNAVPVTSYYRVPQVPVAAQPTAAYYAPAPSGVVQANYSPGLSYRVGTPDAAAYTSAYSPIVTPTTPYAANWQYPPQTVMPTTANYAPVPPRYVTNYAPTPVTAYRPVTVLSPTGTPQTVLQPCAGSECQAQRQHQGFFGWLFHHNRAPATTANYGCASGYCGAQPAPLTTPYYTPGPAPIGTTSTTTIPANIAPTLSGPPPVSNPVGSATTIIPNVQPSQINSSGGQRADYPPAADAYCPPGESFRPNISSPAVTVPATPTVPLTPVTPQIESTPADASPMLKPPTNAPIGSGVQPRAEEGARLRLSPPYKVDTQTPGAILRRDNNVTPIPDPEYGTGTRAKVNKAPQLLTPSRDRTAQAPKAEAQLAGFEQPAAPIHAKPNQRPVLGDEIWGSAK